MVDWIHVILYTLFPYDDGFQEVEWKQVMVSEYETLTVVGYRSSLVILQTRFTVDVKLWLLMLLVSGRS